MPPFTAHAVLLKWLGKPAGITVARVFSRANSLPLKRLSLAEFTPAGGSDHRPFGGALRECACRFASSTDRRGRASIESPGGRHRFPADALRTNGGARADSASAADW